MCSQHLPLLLAACCQHLVLLQILYQLFSNQKASVVLTQNSLERSSWPKYPQFHINGWTEKHEGYSNLLEDFFSFILQVFPELSLTFCHQLLFISAWLNHSFFTPCRADRGCVCCFSGTAGSGEGIQQPVGLGDWPSTRGGDLSSCCYDQIQYCREKKGTRNCLTSHFSLFRVGMTRHFDALHRGVRGFGHAREGRGWAWWQAPWRRCLLASACPPCPCPPLWTWCPRNSSSLKVRYNTNQTPLPRHVYSSLCFLFGFFLLVLTD